MDLKNSGILVIITFCSSSLYASSQADNSAPLSASMLDQVTVTATKMQKTLDEIAGTIDVIGQRQMSNQLSTNIKDALRYETGVEIGGQGRSGLSGFNIRGLQGNRVKILVDGVEVPRQFDSSSSYLQSQRNFVDIEAMKAIEIIKGPNSSLYGSDALGGIVSFVSKDPKDYLRPSKDNYSAIKTQYNSNNDGTTNTLTQANRFDKLETLLVYTRRDFNQTETNAGPNIDGPARGSADPLNAYNNNILTKLQYQLNNNQRLGLVGEYLQERSNTDLKSGGSGDFALPSATRGQDEKTRTRLGLSHEWKNADLALLDNSKWQLDWQNSETDQHTHIPAYRFMGRPYPNRFKKYDYAERGWTLNGTLDKTLDLYQFENTFVYGVNVSRIEASSSNTTINTDTGSIEPTSYQYMPDVKALKYGFFLQDEIQLSQRLKLVLGSRYDYYEYDPSSTEDFTTAVNKTDDNKVTAKIGTIYQLNNNLSVFAQFSQGFKAPDYKALYFNINNPTAGYSVLANPNLKAETGNSFEVGLKGENQYGSFESSAYYNRYDDFIDEQVPVDPSLCGFNGVGGQCFQAQNLSTATIKGLEFTGQLWLDTYGAPLGTSVKTSLAYAKGEGKESGKSSQPLNSVAPLKGVITLAYDQPNETWGGALHWTLVRGKQSNDVDKAIESGSQYIPPGYGLIDITAYYRPIEKLTLRAGVFNITNKKYWQWNSVQGVAESNLGLDRYSEPGRNLALSLNYEF